MSKTELPPSPSTEPVKQKTTSKPAEPEQVGKFTCVSETVEEGKTFHYLYNPDEKDHTKSWKRSTECVN